MIQNGLETKIGTFTFLRVNGKTLMLFRNKNPEDFLYGKYLPPGGKIEKGETPEISTLREFKEETNLILQNLVPRGFVFFNNKNRNFRGKPATFNFLVYVFESTSYEGDLQDPDVGTLVWVPDNSLTSLPIENGDHYIIDFISQGIPIHHEVILSDQDSKIQVRPKDEFEFSSLPIKYNDKGFAFLA